jgi:tRNA (cmo5U34)-methyltransferase
MPTKAFSSEVATGSLATNATRLREENALKQSSKAGAEHFLSVFSDPERVARYADGPRRYVPGLVDLHRMTGILLAEKAPRDARILVLGAGGGLELKALAEAHPGWSFVGVDPSAEMLGLAAHTLGPLALGPLGARVELIQGYIEDAPAGPFDAATCLLTLHFLASDERRRTASEIRRRLKPGAPFVAAHGSFPQGQGEGEGQDERALWLSRYAAFAITSGVDPDQANAARTAVDTSVSMLSPEQDEAILREAGFADVTLFFAAFTWRGWIAHA